MSYNLFGFSSGAFEQFTQTVALNVIGPGIVVFGRGPDGGREATFSGTVPYPFETDKWSGYGVIQAKCKEKTDGTAIDQEWALIQLKKELDGFLTSKKRLQMPEYYIFVTNVVMTPAPKSGGKDRIDLLFNEFHKKIPLKGYRIWDHDQLVTFLNTYRDLRRRYRAYTTPGDVLATIIAGIESQQANFSSIATAFLDRQLRAEEDAKLDQGGKRTDERNPLAAVFIDLPTSSQPKQEPPEEEDETRKLPSGFLRELLDIGSLTLDPKTLSELLTKPEQREDSSNRITNRFVLIGGPGSGKSTIGQFLSQIHRAAILAKRANFIHTPETQDIINKIKEYCVQESLPWPTAPRFPFRIDLSSFAKALSSTNSDSVKTLAEYLTHHMRSDRSMKVEDLIRWLASYPWLLILDGLDEVPISSNREAVRTAIQDFLAQAAHQNANLLVLATTRKEGYNNEFGADSFRYCYMLPLSIKRALAYVKRFALARFGNASPRVGEMLSTLQNAAGDGLTAKLMQTPLQVTFMATLVAAGGSPPRDRWKLFNDYYSTIYKREQQKADDRLRPVLDRQSTLIDHVHHDVGFILQIQGEIAGKTDAMLSVESFETLVSDYLTEAEWEEPEKTQLKDLISNATTTRLVFLTSRIAGKVSFDVRSLQEYMAAERLMTGVDAELLRKRLAAIAPLAYWRNVFLFAAGKCFATSQLNHFLFVVYEICEELNEKESGLAEATTLLGAKLALELLEDGAVTHIPKYAKKFMRIALKLLDLDPLGERETFDEFENHSSERLYIRLARLCDTQVSSIFQDEINNRLQSPESTHAFGAWALLNELITQGVIWAQELATQKWKLISNKKTLISEIMGGTTNPWSIDCVCRVIPDMSFKEINSKQGYLWESEFLRQRTKLPEWLAAIFDLEYPSRAHRSNAEIRLPGLNKDILSISYISIKNEECAKFLSTIARIPAPSNSWAPFLAGAEFINDPRKETLVAQLLELESVSATDLTAAASLLPWPLGSCLPYLAKAESRRQLIDKIAEGALGDLTDWLSAEQRWSQFGVSFSDIVSNRDSALPFDKTIATRGFPVPLPSIQIDVDRPINQIADSLTSALDAVGSEIEIAEICRLMLFNWAVDEQEENEPIEIDLPNLSKFKLTINESLMNDHKSYLFSALTSFDWPETIQPDWLDFLEHVGTLKLPILFQFPINLLNVDFCEQLAAIYTVNPHLHGILYILSALTAAGHTPSIPLRLLSPRRFAEPCFQGAALVVSLVQRNLTDEETKILAQDLITIERLHPNTALCAIHTLQRHGRIGPAFEALVVNVHNELKSKNRECAIACISLLNDIIRRKNSGLNGIEILETLDLRIKSKTI